MLTLTMRLLFHLLLYHQRLKPQTVPNPALVLAMAGVMVLAGRRVVRAVRHTITRWHQ